MSSDADYAIAGTIADKVIVRLVYMQSLPLIGRFIWLLVRLRGTDIPPRSVHPSRRLHLPHAGIGVVVHPHVRLGENVTLFHGVTIGRSDVWRPIQASTECQIGDDVIVGTGAAILFGPEGLTVGQGAVIGANAVVTQSVGRGEVWAGSPARRVASR